MFKLVVLLPVAVVVACLLTACWLLVLLLYGVVSCSLYAVQNAVVVVDDDGRHVDAVGS